MNSLSKASFLVIAISASIPSVAQVLSDPNLQNYSTAKARYDAYQSSGSNDPFEDLSEGYSQSYVSELQYEIAPSEDSYRKSATTELSATNTSRVANYSSDKQATLASIYNASIGTDGTFDAESYMEMLDDYRESKSIKQDNHRTDSRTQILAIMSDKNSSFRAASDDVNADVGTATVNLINSMSLGLKQDRSDGISAYNAALSRFSTQASEANATLILASTFAGCGSACEIHEPTPATPIIVNDEVSEPVTTPVTYTPIGSCFADGGSNLVEENGSYYYRKCP